jgi:hypothetical protein
MINLTCKTCNSQYEKPDEYKTYSEIHPNVFWKWNLTYCDTCRKAKQLESFKELPKIINALCQTQ